MRKVELITTLKQLSISEDRSEIARMREIYEEIEVALKAGVSQKKVLDQLNENGFHMSSQLFALRLHRIRKDMKQSSNEIGKTSRTMVPVNDFNEPIHTNAFHMNLVPTGGKTKTEQVMGVTSKEFSFKQLQKIAKEKK